MNDKCPDCASENLLVGNFPLMCLDCEWSYLNKYPCRVCGAKSVSACGSNSTVLYGCKDHPVTEEEQRRLWSAFAEALKR